MKIFRLIIVAFSLIPIAFPMFGFVRQSQRSGNAVSQMQGQAEFESPVDCRKFPTQSQSPYALPYEVGKAFEVIRTTSHYTRANGGVGLYAIDFRMPIGTPVTAARGGKVVAVQDSFRDGNGENLRENYVFVKHHDATIGRYFHLTHKGALVKVGDKVRQGQVIARSGNTGQSTEPHLHFDVQKCGPNLPPNYNQLPCGQTVPLAFRNTRSHSCGLVPGKSYLARDRR